MVVTRMMVDKELNPLGWLFGLPLLVAVGWVILDVTYGRPIAHLAIVAGVLDIAIGFFPMIKEAKKQSDWVSDIEDGTNRKRQEERIKSDAQVAQQEYNEDIKNVWMPDIYKKYPESIHEFGKDEDGDWILYLGTPFWTEDNRILLIQPDRLIKFDPGQLPMAGDRIEASVPTMDDNKPVPADVLLRNIGKPWARINLEGKSMPTFNDFSLFTEMTANDILADTETAMGEAWIYTIGANLEEHDIKTIELAHFPKSRHPLEPGKFKGDQVACRDFALKVMHRRFTPSITVGLKDAFPAVAVFVSRDGSGTPFIEPRVYSKPLMTEAQRIVSHHAVQKHMTSNHSGRTDEEKASPDAL